MSHGKKKDSKAHFNSQLGQGDDKQALKAFQSGSTTKSSENLGGNGETESGVARLGRVLDKNRQVMGFIDEKTKGSGIRTEILMRIAVEDEWQVASCASLPSTIIYFVIFMLFFQQHYGVTDIYLAEKNLRSVMGATATAIDEPIPIYDWMDNYFFPFMWGAVPNATAARQRASVSLYQELIGGVTLTTTRSTQEKCEDPLVNDMNCFSGPDSEENAFEGVELNRRLLSNKLVESSDAYGVAALKDLLAPMMPNLQSPSTLEELPHALSSGEPEEEQDEEEESDEEPSAGAEAPLKRVSMPKGSDKWKPGKRRGLLEGGQRGVKRKRSIKDMMKARDHFEQKFEEQRKLQREQRTKNRARRLFVNRPEIRTDVGSPGAISSEMIVPVAYSASDVAIILQKMRDVELLRSTTRTFTAEGVIVNTNLPGRELLSHVSFTYTFSRGGGVFCTISVVTLVLDEDTDMVSMFLGPCWIVCLVAFTGVLPVRGYQRLKEGTFMKTFFQFWNLLEWAIVVVGWMVVCCWILERMQIMALKKTLDEYEELPSSSNEFSDEQLATFRKINDQTAAATYTSSQFTQVAVAQYHVLLIFRFFLAIRGQPRLAIVLTTVRKASVDLMHLFVVIFTIFIAYAISGHILFGRRIQEFATFQGAISDCFKIVMERQFQWDRFSTQDMMTSMIWVWSFTMLVMLVLVNIFLAMLFDSYGDVRSSVGDAATLWRTTKHMVSGIRQRLRWHKEGDFWIPNRELFDAMHRMNMPTVFPWMLKDAVPGISGRQVNYLFNMASSRTENMLLRNNRDSLPAVVASILIGIESLFQSLEPLGGKDELFSVPAHFKDMKSDVGVVVGQIPSDGAVGVHIDIDEPPKPPLEEAPANGEPAKPAKPDFCIEVPSTLAKPEFAENEASATLEQNGTNGNGANHKAEIARKGSGSNLEKAMTTPSMSFEDGLTAVATAAADEAGESLLPPEEPPYWVTLQLLPHLLKQKAQLNQVRSQIAALNKTSDSMGYDKFSPDASSRMAKPQAPFIPGDRSDWFGDGVPDESLGNILTGLGDGRKAASIGTYPTMVAAR